MTWFAAPDAWLARFVFQRGLALVYVLAFLVALNQFRPLLGEHGLLPAPRFLSATTAREAVTLFRIRYSDRIFLIVAWCGLMLAVASFLTLPDHLPIAASAFVWFAMWLLYLSIVNVGQIFYAFGWESLLLETGFLAVFLGPADVAPPVLLLWLLRWLLFRLEFGAGLIKLRGDPCWRDLSCLDYHHETQPMPNPLSWYFHSLPRAFHRLEVAGNHVAQLVAPLLLFAAQPVAGAGAAVMIATQLWLVMSGNFSWLNLLTIVIALPILGDAWLGHLIPIAHPHPTTPGPLWFVVIVGAQAALVVGLSWWPVRNMASRRQHMNVSYSSLHLVNSYGAFGSVTRERLELVVEGTTDTLVNASSTWREYEFKGKPGDPSRRPPQVAPYHLRLDWLMWFAALSPGYARSWFIPLVRGLLSNDVSLLRLLAHNPFPDAPPAHIRVTLFRYRFTTARERRETGAWWVRRPVREYLAPTTIAT